MATSHKSRLIEIPAKDSDADQRDQMEQLTERFFKLLIRRHGPLRAWQWRREITRFMTISGTTYEQIRHRLEEDFNTELQLRRNELQMIVDL